MCALGERCMEPSLFGDDENKQDIAQALQWYHKAAEAGNVEAMLELADFYRDTEGWVNEDANGIEGDATEAAKWYRKAAEAGNIEAQLNLADLYRDGRGVEKDLAEMVKWYRKAAEQGYEYAMFQLAECYEKG